MDKDEVEREAEKILWEYYESHWEQMKTTCWGEVYADRHRELIEKVNKYAAIFAIKLDQSKFRPIERDFV